VVSLTLPPNMIMSDFAVGDFVLHHEGRVTRLLDRQSHLTRRASGSATERQLIAANLGALAVVSSCNADFNMARIERYLAMARAGGVVPLVVLTKADMNDPAPYLEQLAAAAPDTVALALNAQDKAAVAAALAPWIAPGQTLALAGSSGVGKTTLANALTEETHLTQAIREDDARGRHTTTARHMVRLVTGGWLIDTPGMRELQLTDAAQGLAESFGDLETLSLSCRFSDCGHVSEPGCAVQAALQDGSLDADKLRRWQKLLREDAANSRTLAATHAVNRAFGKVGRKAQAEKKARRRSGFAGIDGD
jgi:ribosome biogenesis GTPase / thiamine phosphate phosphatase